MVTLSCTNVHNLEQPQLENYLILWPAELCVTLKLEDSVYQHYNSDRQAVARCLKTYHSYLYLLKHGYNSLFRADL